MKIIITGGSASGKSSHAERIICKYAKDKLYLATMQPFGQAAQQRIERHLTLRQDKNFDTKECFTNLADFNPQKIYDGILLECMSNLLANEMFSPDGIGFNNAVEHILKGINNIQKYCKVLVIVTSEIFSDGESYPYETIEYCRLLGQINQNLFDLSDAAAESVCGILLPYKGENLL